MKRKIVLWGADAEDKKILVALELLDKDNKVCIYTFSEDIATEDFYKSMMNMWREGRDLPFPEGHTKIERPLSISDSLLPEDIKVDRTDLITRAQAEWHFVVLSAKLYEMYRSELEDFKEKVDTLTQYDGSMWEEMKTFWEKVQNQVQDKNLFREHASTLREKTNNLFDKLKALRKSLDDELNKASAEHKEKILSELKEIEDKIEKGLGLKPLFEDLKDIQKRFKDLNMNRKDKNYVWKKIDVAFKIVKEKRFGAQPENGNNRSRLQRRYDGLMSAIGKMENSIRKDTQENEFQTRRISATDGQLEQQIRQAKVKMIEQRISSKQEKLDDMLKTKEELNKKIEQEQQREKNREEKKVRDQKMSEAKKEAKEKIADEVKASSEKMDEMAEKLEAAAESIADSKKSKSSSKKKNQKKEEKKDDILSAITATVGEALEDVVDTVKAAASVVGEQVEGKAEEIKSKVEAMKEEGDESIMDTIKNKVEDVVESTIEKVKEMAETIEEKVEETLKDEEE